MKVGIIGCGLIGKRRAQIVHQSAEDELVAVMDVEPSRAQSLAAEMGCALISDWHEMVSRAEIEAIVVATPNKFLAPISIAALEHAKHVLCEKPPGRNIGETEEMAVAVLKTGKILKVGFNHRFHPAIWKAHEICARGDIGPLLFIRAMYGHGGRPGYDREWRANAELAGGGELLDQGVHIIDLCRWFMGEFSQVVSFTSTFFWDLGYFGTEEKSLAQQDRLEDNAFALLKTRSCQVAQIHTSWTQWKNQFSFNVGGRDGYVRIEGLGGSYGLETLTIGHRRPESGPPIEEHLEFSGPDLSWQSEWQEFTSAITDGRRPLSDINDSLGTMRTLAALYKSAHNNAIISVDSYMKSK